MNPKTTASTLMPKIPHHNEATAKPLFLAKGDGAVLVCAEMYAGFAGTRGAGARGAGDETGGRPAGRGVGRAVVLGGMGAGRAGSGGVERAL